MADLAKVGADRLARRSTGRGPVREFLTFALGEDAFGVELARIKEILSPPPITPVPRAPADVVGVCSVRGLLVTVVDLKARLRLAERTQTRRPRILLAIAPSGEPVGLWVDEVRQVVRLGEEDIRWARRRGERVRVGRGASAGGVHRPLGFGGRGGRLTTNSMP